MTAIANGNTQGVSTDVLIRVLAATGYRTELRLKKTAAQSTASGWAEMLVQWFEIPEEENQAKTTSEIFTSSLLHSPKVRQSGIWDAV